MKVKTFQKDWNKLHHEGYNAFSGIDVHMKIFHHAMFYLENNPNVLDIGCGTGDMFMNIQQKIGKYNGIDISGVVCEKLREKYKGHEKLGQIKSCPGDGTIPFNDKMFDVVTSCLVFQHLRSEFAQEYLYEANRVLKSGFMILHTTEWTKLQYDQISDHKDAVYGGMYSYTPEKVHHMMFKAGFDYVNKYHYVDDIFKQLDCVWNLFIYRKARDI